MDRLVCGPDQVNQAYLVLAHEYSCFLLLEIALIVLFLLPLSSNF